MVEIKLPDAKPAFEWINGRALQKVSPKWRHALAQGRFFTALDRWARRTRSGVAGTEWRFRLQPTGETRRPLVPDVAYVSYKRLPHARIQTIDEPTIAPDAVVEVKSPGDRATDIAEKVRIYMATGSAVLFLVDPRARTVTIVDASGRRRLGERAVITHRALPHFRLAVKELFELPRPRYVAKK
ncbi:MAG: Uma2 family endonuclease [Candidatus Eremiobacteraeota bacterium]|nr:Uma2 family endonuclease [Candidatus Eremiobacteraeota bacterium]